MHVCLHGLNESSAVGANASREVIYRTRLSMAKRKSEAEGLDGDFAAAGVSGTSRKMLDSGEMAALTYQQHIRLEETLDG